MPSCRSQAATPWLSLRPRWQTTATCRPAYSAAQDGAVRKSRRKEAGRKRGSAAEGLITAPFGASAWLVQGIAAAIATTVTLPYGALVGVLLYLDLRARKERLDLGTIKADLQASTA